MDWSNQARRFAECWEGEPFHSEVEAWTRRSEPGDWGVACSGGADSLTLLLLLWRRFPRERRRMRVLHVNHGLRGADADADAAFVASVAEGLSLPCVSGHARFRPGDSPGEAELRAARQDFFQASGCAAIWLGHQRDDVAETLLMRLCRGAGTEGLAAPRPVAWPRSGGPVHLRPLLEWPRVAIVERLRAAGLHWREDASNGSPDYFRNRVRLRAWPALREASPSEAAQGFARSRRLLQEDAEALDEWLGQVGPNLNADTLSRAPLVGLPAALWRRALWGWLTVHGVAENLSATAVDELLARWQAGERVRVSVGRDRVVETGPGGALRLVPVDSLDDWPAMGLAPGSGVAWPGGGWLRAKSVVLDEATRQRVCTGGVDESTEVCLAGEAGPVHIRLWRAGDRYQPLGAPGTRKLQDIFTDRKVDARARRRLPVVTTLNGDILWVPGLPPAESHRVGSGTKRALWLTWGLS